MVGYHTEVLARQERMLGIQNPLDRPVFDTLQDAEDWYMYVMLDHYDRGLEMSDARIELFQGANMLILTPMHEGRNI